DTPIPFKKTFRPVLSSNQPAWVVISESPAGPCGRIDVSRFEADPAVKNGSHWNYVEKRVSTNPDGSDIWDGKPISCRSAPFADSETVYDWKPPPNGYAVGCDYFSGW